MNFDSASWMVALMQSLANSKDERVSLDAMKYLSDRLFGKAPQSVALNHSGAINLDLAERIRRARRRDLLEH